MITNRLDHETAKRAIALAARAPSVHNSQPWQWLLGGDTLHLMADRTRHLPATDPQGRDLLISCGAMLHHTQVALASLGWVCDVHRIPNPAQPDHLAALEPRQHTPSIEDIGLVAAISRRRTDRRRFSDWPVPPGHLDLMIRRAAATGALLVPVTDTILRHHLATSITLAAAIQETNPDYAAELAIWSGRGQAAEDGVLAASAPPGPQVQGDTRMRTFAHGSLTESPVDSAELDAGEVLVLATPDDDPRSWLRAGEALSAALLTATELNLAGCPLSQPLEVDGTRAAIQQSVLDDAAVPHLILRVGWAPTSAEPLPLSPRRHLDDIVGYLPGYTPKSHGR